MSRCTECNLPFLEDEERIEEYEGTVVRHELYVCKERLMTELNRQARTPTGSVTKSTNEDDEAPTCTPDQEAWTLDRIETVIRMANALKEECRVGADNTAYQYGLKALVHGTVKEILRTLNITPCYINLKRPPIQGNGARFIPCPPTQFHRDEA